MLPRQRRKWLWTFVFIGVILCFSVQSSEDASSEKDEIKAILGSGPIKATSVPTSMPPPVQSPVKANNTKKLNIVVSSINEEGIKEAGQMATEVKAEDKEAPAPPEDRGVGKNNQTESPEAVFLPAEGAAEKEHSSSLAIFFVLFVLILCIFLVHFLLLNKCHYIPESLAVVFLGGTIGLAIKLLPSSELQKVESFSPTTFFLVLLPPIIFESGYNLHKGNFFTNLGDFVIQLEAA